MSDAERRFVVPRVEWALLGAAASDPSAFLVADGLVAAADFDDPRHGAIWAAIARLHTAHRPLDAVTLATELGNHLTAAQAAGPLDALPWMKVAVAAAEDYARTVARHARARRVLRALDAAAAAPGADPDRFVDRAVAAVNEAAVRREGADLADGGELAMQFAAALDRRAEQGPRIAGLTTGLPSLDARTGGLVPGELVVLAGRPATGKTSLALQIAAAVAERERRTVAVFSLEMPRVALWQRLCCARAGVSSTAIRQGRVDGVARRALDDASQALSRLPLRITDRAPLRVEEVAASCAVLKARDGLGLVVIDYLGKLEMPGKTGREREDQLIATAVRALAALAKRLEVAVLLLAALNRSGDDGKDDREPTLRELYGGSAIEFEAHAVWILQRVKARASRPGAPVVPAHTRVAMPKQREGVAGSMRVGFVSELTRFEDWQDPPEPRAFDGGAWGGMEEDDDGDREF